MCRSLQLLAEENKQKGIQEGISLGIHNRIMLLLNHGKELNVAVADCAVQ